MLSVNPAEVDTRPSDGPSVPRPAPPTSYPFVQVSGLSNFRDIGGWPINSSSRTGHVRKGILYRGGDTNRITPEGEAKLRELNIKSDFDLRSSQQIQKTGGYRDIAGVERRWAPVFNDEEYTEEEAKRRYELYAADGTDGIVTAFVEILTSGAQTFASILRHLLATVPSPSVASDSPPPALFMHCTTGNNRTGIFISLLLLLLEVPPSDICAEYALSEQGLAPTRHINVERLLKKGAFSEYGDQARARCERMVGAREESMRAMIEEVDRKWGSVEGYFRDVVELSDEEIKSVKNVLTIWDNELDREK